jgi:radical SAM protein with 4Fe4S-binding SPASM domain
MDPKKILTNKSFCVLPWTGFELEPNGDVKTCIIAKEVLGSIHDNSIDEILQSKKMLEIKQAMLDDKKPFNCEGCYLQEVGRKNNFESISSRLYYMKELAPFVETDLYDDIKNFDPYHVDLRWTNHCNQACVYCTPSYSSKWAQELGRSVKSDKISREKLKEFVFSNIKKLKNVYLAGGEPMLMKENKEFLELLLKENPDCTIRVNTNLSTTQTGVFELLCRFKNVHWTVSVETIENEYNYIRHHGDWNDFSANLKTIQQLNHKISFNMLWFVLNYESIFDAVNYFKSIGFHNNSFIIGPVLTPLSLNILNLPNTLLGRVRSRLQQEIDKKPGWLLQNSYENMLKYQDDTVKPDIQNTLNFLSVLDKRRGVDSRKVFPKFYSEIAN